MYYIDFLASAMIVVESNLPKEPSFFLRLLDRLAWLLKKKQWCLVQIQLKTIDLINLVCPEGLEGHVRCLLGLAGGVKNLQVRN